MTFEEREGLALKVTGAADALNEALVEYARSGLRAIIGIQAFGNRRG